MRLPLCGSMRKELPRSELETHSRRGMRLRPECHSLGPIGRNGDLHREEPLRARCEPRTPERNAHGLCNAIDSREDRTAQRPLARRSKEHRRDHQRSMPIDGALARLCDVAHTAGLFSSRNRSGTRSKLSGTAAVERIAGGARTRRRPGMLRKTPGRPVRAQCDYGEDACTAQGITTGLEPMPDLMHQ